MPTMRLEQLELNLRLQHKALLELIGIALLAVRESGDSSVGAIHLNTRLRDLAAQLNDAMDHVPKSNVRMLRATSPRSPINA